LDWAKGINTFMVKKENNQMEEKEMRTNVFPYWIGLWVLAIILVLVFGH
jgi:hypothetical protein